MEEREWYNYDNGKTAGKRGLVDGRILLDAEYGDAEEPEDADARVTLESTADGYAVTANLYGGWLQETARFADEAAARVAFDAAKAQLSDLAALIPDESERNMDTAIASLNTDIATFVSRFGGKPTL